MNLADVHAHLELFDADALKSAIKRAEEKGVKAVITNSTSPETNRKALQLQQQFKIVRAALGIYPANAAAMSGEELDKELEFMSANSSSFAAFGEIGLDYEETEDRKKQQHAFEEQLEMAKKLGKPAIVHSRKAEAEVVETLISRGCRKAILHAFHGSMKLAKKAADNGFYLSIPSNILRSSHFRKMAEILKFESILTETDTPYLGPYSDRKSEPSYVELSITEIAKIKKTSTEQAAEQIYRNYLKLFEQTTDNG
ncbi:TatD family hydrolase [Candidatus Woesearchaeota archaeon]|nr:TatD family hydrolase [Candidatus Woesearchaeota archaeon]